MEENNIEIKSRDKEEDEKDVNLDKIIEERKKKIINIFKKDKDKKTEEEIVEEKREYSKEDKIIEDKSGKIKDEEVIRIRKDKIKSLLKGNYNWISYIILAIIVWMAVKIRTRNLPRLTDITTGTWTLGPDLDPFLFLRWAKHIVENGSLFVIDTMRYVPLGFETKRELLLHPYMIAWFHNIASIFGSESVTQSAVFYPVFFFAITVIAFFLLARKIFIDKLGKQNANIIALVSSFFLVVLPPLLPRTIAGIPEKESAAFFFLFMSFYLFLSAWKSKHKYGRYIFAVFAGASTAGMALVWGGYGYIFLTLSVTVLGAFLLGKVTREKFYLSIVWIITAFALMYPFSTRYSIKNLLTSINTGIFVLVLFIILIHFIIWNTRLKTYFKKENLSKIPEPIISLVVAMILGIVMVSVFFGPGFIADKFNLIIDTLIRPAGSRLIQTVAENRQPYFGEWSNNFGPNLRGIPIFFWLFFIGSIYLFFNMIKVFDKKERWILSIGYIIFLISIIFSRYSPNHILNGENSISLFMYFGGTLLFLIIAGFYYFKYYKEGNQYKLKSIDFGWLLLFSFFILGIFSARGGVRLIMMLVPATSIIVSYFVVMSFVQARKTKKESFIRVSLFLFSGLIIIAAIFSGYQFYKVVNSQAESFAPSIYTQQWQKAMAWVRENTQENAVFGHWWDYGYWIQSIGERATVLDGGNAQGYWNYLMGRHALTGTDERKTLEFLYAHNTTHFLIDSTDIGKYGAFSFIGSDKNLDRRSFISTFLKDNSQTQERKNSTLFVYPGGAILDEDIIYEENDSKIFLPGGSAGVGAILIERDNSGKLSSQPLGVYVHQQQQYSLPLRYAYDNGEFIDFNNGIEAGVFIMPRINQNGGQLQIDTGGALFYLSRRTVKTHLARLYLYEEENEFFKIAHIEDDFLISNLKAQGLDMGNFAYFNGFRGPIKIWEIHYPEDIEFKKEFIDTRYPEELSVA